MVLVWSGRDRDRGSSVLLFLKKSHIILAKGSAMGLIASLIAYDLAVHRQWISVLFLVRWFPVDLNVHMGRLGLALGVHILV